MDVFDKIAQEHVDGLDEVLLGVKSGFANRKEYLFKVYYDYIFLDKDGNIPSEPIYVGGAPGFIIDKKTHEVNVLTFGGLSDFLKSEGELKYAYDKLREFSENSESLLWLKSHYNLNSKEILNFKKTITEARFSKEIIIQELSKIISNKACV